jgi:TRAP-type C4-dicarboxylate transport system permease small subunit
LALWVASVGMILMTAMVAWQVFARYVLNSSPSWTEPLSIMVMSWFIFLGAAVGVRENFHMGFDVLIHFMPGAGPWMRAISDLAVLVFGIGMVVYGGQLTIDTWTAIIPVLHLPGGFAYMPIVAGGLLMALFALERLALRLAGVSVDHDLNAEEVLMTEA